MTRTPPSSDIAGSRPLRVLMASPPQSGAGGMASVAAALVSGTDTATSRYRARMIDSGGGAGRAGYARFPLAVATVARGGYDLLHLHVASKGSTLRKAVLAEAARRRGIPYVIHLHGGGYEAFLDALPPGGMAAVQRFYRHAGAVVVLGERWRDLVAERLDVPQERIHIVHNGVPRATTPPPKRGAPPTILFLGVVTHRKGADVLLDALTQVLTGPGGEEWEAEIVGPTPEPDIVRQAELVAAATGGRVRLTGPRFGAEKEDCIARASIFTLPSRNEALPMAILEAMSAEVACVCTDVGSVSEIVGPDSELLPAGDAEALAGALLELMSDPALRDRRAAEGHRRWQRGFTVESMVAGMTRAWDQALDRGEVQP